MSFLRYWGPVCGYACVMFYLSSLPHPDQGLPSFLDLFSDKVLHAVEYAVFGGLCYRALRRGADESWRHGAVPLAVLLASLYGISDEVHQAFVPFRDSSWLDWLADSVGAAFGALAMSRAPILWSASSASDALPRR